MGRPTTAKRSQLRGIARRAMLARGLLPDFAPDVLAEVAAIREAPRDTGPTVRDLRGLPWVSIDNDDSRDLDQLSVSEPAPDGAVQILVAVADVDAVVHRDSAVDPTSNVASSTSYDAKEQHDHLR